jgi:hypothetical protein
MTISTPMLVTIMVVCFLGAVVEAFRGSMSRCLVLMLISLGIGGYIVLQAFVPGGRR